MGSWVIASRHVRGLWPDVTQHEVRPPLGILAGGGPLPGHVAAAARAAGRSVFIVGLEGFAERAVLEPYPHEFVRLGAAGRALQLLREQGCRDLVIIGPVRRPSLFDLRPDAEGARILARLGRAVFAGDDGLLAALVTTLADEGFHVIGAHEILEEVLAPPGLLTRAAPDSEAMRDVARGIEVVRALGAADVGQACVVQQGIVLAVEAVEGTDAMLERCRVLARPGVGGLLVKLAKPGQELRADMPTIGPRTVGAAAASGLRGIAFEAGGTILTDRQTMIEAADAAELFLLGVEPDQPGGQSRGKGKD